MPSSDISTRNADPGLDSSKKVDIPTGSSTESTPASPTTKPKKGRVPPPSKPPPASAVSSYRAKTKVPPSKPPPKQVRNHKAAEKWRKSKTPDEESGKDKGTESPGNKTKDPPSKTPKSRLPPPKSLPRSSSKNDPIMVIDDNKNLKDDNRNHLVDTEQGENTHHGDKQKKYDSTEFMSRSPKSKAPAVSPFESLPQEPQYDSHSSRYKNINSSMNQTNAHSKGFLISGKAVPLTGSSRTGEDEEVVVIQPVIKREKYTEKETSSDEESKMLKDVEDIPFLEEYNDIEEITTSDKSHKQSDDTSEEISKGDPEIVVERRGRTKSSVRIRSSDYKDSCDDEKDLTSNTEEKTDLENPYDELRRLEKSGQLVAESKQDSSPVRRTREVVEKQLRLNRLEKEGKEVEESLGYYLSKANNEESETSNELEKKDEGEESATEQQSTKEKSRRKRKSKSKQRKKSSNTASIFDARHVPYLQKDLFDFVTLPLSAGRGHIIRCFIERNTSGPYKIDPLYTLMLEVNSTSGRPLIYARNIPTSRLTSHFVLSLNKDDLFHPRQERSEYYLGKLRGKTGRLEYVLYDGGENPENLSEEYEIYLSLRKEERLKAESDSKEGFNQADGRQKEKGKSSNSDDDYPSDYERKESSKANKAKKDHTSSSEEAPSSPMRFQIRKELCYIKFAKGKKTNTPKMQVAIPAIKFDKDSSSASYSVICPPEDESISKTFNDLEDRGGQNVIHHDEILCFHKRETKYDPLSSCIVDFKSRATCVSVKNFQLIHSKPTDTELLVSYEEKNPSYNFEDEGTVSVPLQHVMLQMGKVGKDCFNVDFQYPLSMLQVFSICLSRFDTKQR